jgi:hypothetical protein
VREARRLWLAIAFTLTAASSAQAQVKWDSPFLVAPRPAPGLGLYLVDLDGAGVGALVTWLPSATSWGFRGGIAERCCRSDGIAAILGADVSIALTRNSTEMPLDIDAILGVGAGIADDLIVSVPLGLTIGHTFTGQGAQFTPYAIPRISVDAWFGDSRDENLDLEFTVDIGLDLRFQQGWLVRFGGSIGDRDGIGIGIVF